MRHRLDRVEHQDDRSIVTNRLRYDFSQREAANFHQKLGQLQASKSHSRLTTQNSAGNFDSLIGLLKQGNLTHKRKPKVFLVTQRKQQGLNEISMAHKFKQSTVQVIITPERTTMPNFGLRFSFALQSNSSSINIPFNQRMQCSLQTPVTQNLAKSEQHFLQLDYPNHKSLVLQKRILPGQP